MEFKDILKCLREQKKLTQQELADKSGLSRISIGNYERGDRKPNIDITKKIAQALNVNINTLLGDESGLKQELSLMLNSYIKEIAAIKYPDTSLDEAIVLLHTLDIENGFDRWNNKSTFTDAQLVKIIIYIIEYDVSYFLDIFKIFSLLILELNKKNGNLIDNALNQLHLSLDDLLQQLSPFDIKTKFPFIKDENIYINSKKIIPQEDYASIDVSTYSNLLNNPSVSYESSIEALRNICHYVQANDIDNIFDNYLFEEKDYKQLLDIITPSIELFLIKKLIKQQLIRNNIKN